MDYIKSWYEYFRGNTTNRVCEKKEEDLKTEILNFGNYSSVPYGYQSRDTMDNFFSDIMNVFVNVSYGQPENSDVTPDTDWPFHGHSDTSGRHWPFDSEMFHDVNNMQKNFLNLVNEMHNGFRVLQNSIFEDFGEQNLENYSGCNGCQQGESIRDNYLRVPPLATSDDTGKEVNVIIPGNDGNKMSNIDSTPNVIMPHFQQKRLLVSVSVGPDGDLEMTKITKDSNGKTEKTVTKLNLKDKK